VGIVKLLLGLEGLPKFYNPHQSFTKPADHSFTFSEPKFYPNTLVCPARLAHILRARERTLSHQSFTVKLLLGRRAWHGACMERKLEKVSLSGGHPGSQGY
jgi:hypothetical protein